MDTESKRPNYGNNFDDFLMAGSYYLRSDIYEQDNNYIVEIDIPGIAKDNINIECQNGYLMVSVSNGEGKEETGRNYIRRERHYAEYARQFYLGNVDCDNIVASYNDGILRIVVPRQEEITNNRRIEIE